MKKKNQWYVSAGVSCLEARKRLLGGFYVLGIALKEHCGIFDVS